ncbi:polysaccharide biosynthesis/export family protein [Frigoriglobus tundricola]|uniref:Polysaccharide export protein N-terminal domain-containing protein n=1 Tax=Frigoriglobus tundricola TaxID=2774151 RepID=A0A6M5YZC3_9BACT|nr:polysaccharide biosynthesis/export family protein [Frigoriglobus tundricola]QJW99305.1 hypothetical protein FTUN_6908 [Frigoriglobus tundricola]
MAGARRVSWVALSTSLALATVGCMHGSHGFDHAQIADGAPIAVPPSGAVPRELEKIAFPPYVIEAPDVLLIEVIQMSKVSDPSKDKGKEEGKNGKDPGPPKPAVEGDKAAADNQAYQRLPVQPISGQFHVRLDGTVGLGFWGSVPVAGLTLDQASEAIRAQLARSETLKEYGTSANSLRVIVDVLAYNSKKYYVIFDGGGFGEQVFPFPITGGETVLDALANINGLPDVASRRNIWVARRTPHDNQPWQILPVDWIGITQHGITRTNYQVFPGDRIYVKAQKLVTIDRNLARIISPIERLFGITLLGSSTVNQIRGTNTNGTGN